MAQKLVVFLCLQAVIFQAAFSQCINRIVPISQPNCGCGCGNIIDLPNLVFNQPFLLDGQLVGPVGPVVGPVGPCGPIVGPVGPCGPIAPAPTTIIQDSTVANNLANALQLLVVSNLLSNTLPLSPEPMVELAPLAAPLALPSCGCNRNPCGCGLNGFSYIY